MRRTYRKGIITLTYIFILALPSKKGVCLKNEASKINLTDKVGLVFWSLTWRAYAA